jgi:aminoglycoside N3'-acetyltransferase
MTKYEVGRDEAQDEWRTIKADRNDLGRLPNLFKRWKNHLSSKQPLYSLKSKRTTKK